MRFQRKWLPPQPDRCPSNRKNFSCVNNPQSFNQDFRSFNRVVSGSTAYNSASNAV